MTRKIAIALAAVLFLQVAQAGVPSDPRDQALAIDRASKVEVRMLNGSRLLGYIGDVHADHLSLVFTRAPNAYSRDLMFSDVSSVRRTRAGVSAKALLIVGAVVVVALVIVGLRGNRHGSWIS